MSQAKITLLGELQKIEALTLVVNHWLNDLLVAKLSDDKEAAQTLLDSFAKAWIPNKTCLTLRVGEDLAGVLFAGPFGPIATDTPWAKWFQLWREGGRSDLVEEFKGRSARIVRILAVAIEDRFRGKGLLESFFSSALNHFKALGYEYVTLLATDEAQADLLTRMGFQAANRINLAHTAFAECAPRKVKWFAIPL